MKRVLLWALAILAIPALAFAYTLVGYPKFQAFDSNGVPLAGGKLYTYQPGSGTSKAVYQYSTGTAHTNPVILDSRGEATIFFNGSYKLVLKDADDALIWTLDNFQGTGVEYDTTSSVSGYIAISAQSGTSEVRFIPELSGASIVAASIPSTKLVDPVEAGVSTAQTVTGKTYYTDMSTSATISGQTLYGGAVGNWGSTSEVTATLPSAAQGMAVFFALTQGQVNGSSLFVVVNSGDNVIGVTSAFSAGNSVMQLSGTTMGTFLQLEAWRDNWWYATGVIGLRYRNK